MIRVGLFHFTKIPLDVSEASKDVQPICHALQRDLTILKNDHNGIVFEEEGLDEGSLLSVSQTFKISRDNNHKRYWPPDCDLLYFL